MILFFVSTLYAQSPFGLKKSDNTTKFEVQIIAKIAKDIVDKDLKIYLIGASDEFRELISKENFITNNCRDANFIYVAAGSGDNLKHCKNESAVYFTSDRELFEREQKFIGLFYWFKSRPNIIFLAKRLHNHKIALPNMYKRFVEEF